jgi:fatty-acyl-CoA synthase
MSGETLASALMAHEDTDALGLRFLDRRERATHYSWAQIRQRAMAWSGRLLELGIQPGERVVLVYATGIGFFDAFFGCVLAGAVPTPVYPPVRLGRMEEYHQRTARMIELASARLVLAEARVKRVLGRTDELARPALGIRTLEELPPASMDVRLPVASDLAMVQFSSGTTVEPKPVALSHTAVMAQTRILEHEITVGVDESVHPQAGCSWLPLYHDMGLIGCVFPALVHPGDLTLIGPENFIARPAVWLRAISTWKGTVSPAPNFAFALCVDRIQDEQLEGVDLSHWRTALNGAEPVAPEVLRAFTQRFARWGLRPEALTPVYGLSEASLAVSFSPIAEPFSGHCFSRRELAEGRAVEDPEGVELVSVGGPVKDYELRVVGEGDVDLPEGAVGTVLVRGPSLMDGYLGRPELTAQALRGGWLDTGDLGFLHQGQLFVTGRKKDVLILRGRNHAPHPLEQACDAVPGVRTGCAAAASYRPEGAETERLVIFVEHSAEATPPQIEALPQACIDEVLRVTGLKADLVLELSPGTLPRTSSGKIRRGKALALWRSGELIPPDQVGLLRVAGIMAGSALAYLRARR